MDRWFPVARSAELVPRHVAQTQLLGQEIALWRSDSGALNVWENRCPHRGVRLSIGTNTGTELRCQYHGWRFIGGTGQCTFIPAHPTQKPASTVRAHTYAVIERFHLVWVNLDSRSNGRDPPDSNSAAHFIPPDLPFRDTEIDTTLRSLFINAPATAVSETLCRGYQIDPASPARAPIMPVDPFTLTEAVANAPPAIVFLLQPASPVQTILHGMLAPGAFQMTTAARIPLLRHHNSQLNALRDTVESGLTGNP